MTAEDILARGQAAERAACALGLVAVSAVLMLHSWSAAAAALRRGPVEGALLVSDSLSRPTRTEAVWLRYDPANGTLDLVSLPPEATLQTTGARRRVGRAYAAALKEIPEPAAGDLEEPRLWRELTAAEGRRSGAASAAAVRWLREGLRGDRSSPGAQGLGGPDPHFLHLEEAGLRDLGGEEEADPDAEAVGAHPGLRRATALARRTFGSPAGPWAMLSALGGRTGGVSGLSRYDLAVLGYEALALPARRVRPVQLPAGRRGVLGAEALDRLWTETPPARPIQVEVLNAGSRPGAAAVVTRALRERGVDVVYYGNSGMRLRRTWVLDRSGDRAAAREVRRLLPAADPQEWTALSPERLLHASVLLGDDIKTSD